MMKFMMVLRSIALMLMIDAVVVIWVIIPLIDLYRSNR